MLPPKSTHQMMTMKGIKDKKKMKKTQAMKKRHLDCLPDHLLLPIFDMVRDARFLARCLPVSRRFMSLVPLTASVSTTCLNGCHRCNARDPLGADISVQFTSKSTDDGNKYNLYLTDQYPPYIMSHWEGGDPQSFTELRNLHVDVFHSSRKECFWCSYDRSVFCKVELGGNTQLIKNCIMVDFENQRPAFHRLQGDFSKSASVSIIQSLLSESISIHSLLRRTVTANPTLRDVVMVDASCSAIFHAGEEEITSMIRAKPWPLQREHRIRGMLRHLSIKLWHVPLLPLPGSGDDLKGVTVTLMMDRDCAAMGGLGEFLVSSFDDADPRLLGKNQRAEERDRTSKVGEAIMEMSKIIDSRPCYLEHDPFSEPLLGIERYKINIME